MQRKIAENRGIGTANQSVSAPNISNYEEHTGRKASDWTGELANEDDANMICAEIPSSYPHGATESHGNGQSNSAAESEEDSFMKEEGEEENQRLEVQSQGQPKNILVSVE